MNDHDDHSDHDEHSGRNGDHMLPDDAFSAVRKVQMTMTEEELRVLLDRAIRPSQFLALSCDVFTELFDGPEGWGHKIPVGMYAGHAVLLCYGMGVDGRFDTVIALEPPMAIGLAEQLMQAAVLAITPGHIIQEGEG